MAWRIWKKTGQIAFVLGTALIYYWSLLGAWFIIFDEMTNQKGKEFGLAYYGYLIDLFPVHADNTYLYAIFLYALFIIVIQLSVLFFAKESHGITNRTEPLVNINHFWLILFCVTAVIISLLIVWKQVLIAAKFNQSVYYVTRHYHDGYFTIHQLLNQAAVVSLYIGLITYISGSRAQYMSGSKKRYYLYLYVFAVFFVEGYLLFLGNKRELFFSMIFGILFYMANVNYKINYKALIFFVLLILVPLVFNDGLRSYSPTFLTHYFDVSGLEFNPEKDVIYTQFSVANTIFRFLFSNEMFVPHFSMYGVLSHHVPFAYGASIVSLIASFIPHFLWANRPMGIYEYYVNNVHATADTGFTIHHATGLYLNFGVAGIVFGALFLGWFWTFFYNKFLKIDQTKQKFLLVVLIIAFSSFTAQIPSLMRNGPEGYKALIFEAILIPAVIIYFSSLLVIVCGGSVVSMSLLEKWKNLLF